MVPKSLHGDFSRSAARTGAPVRNASTIAGYDISPSSTFASRPIFRAEWLSELDINATLSSADTRQFIWGSDDNPVSIAKIFGVSSSKHSSNESKPDIEPKMENHGVQACAGTTIHEGSALKAALATSFASIPIIGRPSEAKFPDHESRVLMASAASNDGANKIVWTLRTLPAFE